MKRISLATWAEIYQVGLTLLFALSPAMAVAYVHFNASADEILVAHRMHEVAIATAVGLALFLAHLAWRCHRDSGEALTRHLAFAFLGFAVLYAPHGILTFAAHDRPPLFLLWGPASRLVMAAYVLRGLLAPRNRPAQARTLLPDLLGLAAAVAAVGWSAGFHPEWFPTLRVILEILAGAISLAGLAVLVVTRTSGPILWFHAVALLWFALASGAFLLAKPWNTQWWLAHIISGAGFLLLGWGVAHVYRTSQSFSGFYSPERLFWLLSNAERMSLELQSAKENSERSAQTKAAFLAAASHDLRQPAQALALFSAALSARIEDDHPAATILPHMEEATVALQSILDGLLDVSRLDAGMIAAQSAPLAVAPVLETVAAQAQPRTNAKGLKLRVAAGPPLAAHADAALLTRLVASLVDNAVKYTDRGEIALSARPMDGMIRICVSDTGPGIPRHQQEAIFEEFVQLENPERDRAKGLGLGLAIVRRLATLMGGRVGVHSQPGQGATFWVDVPAAICPPSP